MNKRAYLDVTQRSYDAIAIRYEEQFRTALADRPLDRALLSGFAEMVCGLNDHPQVLEIGSGPGYVSNFLHERGLSIRGIDLSPGMVELANTTYPDINFSVGNMCALDVPDADVDGLVAWYSIIHLEPPDLPVALAEFHRVLKTNGYLLLAFQLGDAVLHLDEAFGHDVDLNFQRLQPQAVKTMLEEIGFDVVAELVQAPDLTSIAEKIPQAFLVAQKRK